MKERVGGSGGWRGLVAGLNRRELALEGRQGLGLGWLVGLFLLTALVLVSRNLPMFLHAQFYAEDGAVWYADAYNLGWLRSLAIPDGGYLNTLQRLGAGPALLVPFRWAPLVMNVLGLLVQCLPVPILVSARCRNWGPLPTRMLMAAVYVVVPNAREIFVVLTNSQWHLALVAPLLVFACAPGDWRGRWFDGAVLLVAGFSGPFCIVLLPVAGLFWGLRRQRWTLVQAGVIAVGAGVQVWMLVHHPAARNLAALGATPALFLRMLGGNIFAAAMFGGFPLGALAPFGLILLAVVCGCAVYVYALRFAPLPLRLLILYALLLLGPELKSPLISGPKPLWDLLAGNGSSRYWFFPMMAFVWSALWMIRNARAAFFRYAGAGILLAMSIGIVADWFPKRFMDTHFADSVAKLREAAPGEAVVMPVLPKDIVMRLVKKGPRGAER